MNKEELRSTLIEGTIHVIAKEGLDKASTKLIGLTTNTNEAYIYRCFNNKEDMFAKVFAAVDDELAAKTMQHLPVMYMQEMEYEMRSRIFFNSVWHFLLENREKCLTFVRYYYSTYFKQYSAQEHKKRYTPLIDSFKNAFRGEANVWMIINFILAAMLNSAVKVFEGELEDNADTAEHLFRLIYSSLQHFLKNKC